MEIRTVKNRDKIGAKSGQFQRNRNIASKWAKNIINVTLINKQIYVLRFYSKVLLTLVFLDKITKRSILGANFPFGPNSEHCPDFRSD